MGGKLWVSLKACDCQKDTGIPAPYSVKPTLPNDSTCSEEAFLLGGGQRVVSFVYYEGVTYDTVRRRDFFSGVEANARAIAGLLPGNFRMRWVCSLPGLVMFFRLMTCYLNFASSI